MSHWECLAIRLEQWLVAAYSVVTGFSSPLLSYIFIEGSLEVKLPTFWTDGKAEVGKSQRREEKKREDPRREKVRRNKVQVREKVEKSRFTVFYRWFVDPEGRKVGSLKRRVEKVHAIVARSTFRSQNKQSTLCSKHCWKLRCRKSARHCGAKHIWKWKV